MWFWRFSVGRNEGSNDNNNPQICIFSFIVNQKVQNDDERDTQQELAQSIRAQLCAGVYREIAHFVYDLTSMITAALQVLVVGTNSGL